VAGGVVDGSFGTHRCDDGADAEPGGRRYKAREIVGSKECTGSECAKDYEEEKYACTGKR
jgi:hypothetical protein